VPVWAQTKIQKKTNNTGGDHVESANWVGVTGFGKVSLPVCQARRRVGKLKIDQRISKARTRRFGLRVPGPG